MGFAHENGLFESFAVLCVCFYAPEYMFDGVLCVCCVLCRGVLTDNITLTGGVADGSVGLTGFAWKLDAVCCGIARFRVVSCTRGRPNM